MNGSPRPKVATHPFTNHLTVLLLVLVLALVGCQESAPLSKRLSSQPQLGQKFATYTFSLPDTAKIKARNPGENFALTQMVFTATSSREGCAKEEKTIPYKPEDKAIAVDLRPGCDYQVKIDGVGLQLGSTPATAENPAPGQAEAESSDRNPAAPGGAVTYQQVVGPLMQKHCVSCHIEQGPMQAYPLGTAEQVKSRIASIIERVALENMPPRGPFFSDNQIAQLKAWRDQGFALTRPLKVSDQTPRLLCTSRTFAFRAPSRGAEASVAPEFVWYFEKGF